MLRRPVRLLVLGGVASVAVLTAALAPGSQAAVGVPAVKGGLVQAYEAVPYVRQTPVKIPSVRYYLSGTVQDDVNRIAGTPSGTFSRTRPTATTDLTQTTSPVVGVVGGGPTGKGSAFWTAPYTGKIAGKVRISWYWSTHDALAGDGNLGVHLWADPGTSTQKEIGSGTAGVSIADGNPHLYTATIDVSGTVSSTLELQATPTYVDAGEDLTVHYGSVGTPSYFEVESGVAPLAPLPTTKKVKDTDPLVLSSTLIGREAGEPTIGVTKAGNAFITASAFDGVGGQLSRTLIYSSTDGNKSWHNTTPMLPADQSVPPASLDPYLYVDSATGRIYTDDLTVGCSYLEWSDDEGKTWSNGNPLACEAPVDDHQTLVTGKAPVGVTTIGYPRVVYYCVNKVADAQCARSIDGGMTFTFTGGLPYQGVEQGDDSNGGATQFCGGLHGHVATDPDGRVLLPKGHCDRPMLAISDDAGTTWRTVLVNRMKVASHQTSVASDSAGNLYYLWIGKEDLLPYLSVSRDHGVTWGPALLVAPPGVAAVNFPTLDATGNGHVAISFPGSTARTATAGRPWNYYVAVTTNALAKRPVFHSATSNAVKDPVHRGACLDRCAGMYDFIDVVISPRNGEVWAAAVDTCISVKCREADPTANPSATAAEGVGVRQLSGPGVRR